MNKLQENEKNIIKSGFRASGIYPIDCNQV